MTRSTTISFLLLVLLLTLNACAPTPLPADQKPQVTVSILPQAYFIERIAGDLVEVNVMVLPGANPATYEPKPDQLKALSNSSAYFSIGVPFETVWLDRITAANDEMQIIDTTAGIERLPMSTDHEHDDETHTEDEPVEAGAVLDPHVWTAPELVRLQAVNIHFALTSLMPDKSQAFDNNLAAFLADIDQLQAELHHTLDRAEQRAFIVFHPSWGYFAEEYELTMIAIEVAGREPSPSELAGMIDYARDNEIRVIFAQPEFSTRDAETIAAEIDGEVLLISPLEKDWLANMQNVAAIFAGVLDN